MARYSKTFKARAVARLLPPENASPVAVAAEFGIRADTLERWRSEALSDAQDRIWTGPARLEAVIHTAALDEASRNAWCREKGLYPSELERWRVQAMDSLGDVGTTEARVTPREARLARQRIKALERDLNRKDKALAETAALLVLSKKLSAIFHESGED